MSAVADKNLQILNDAIGRNAGNVISIPSAGMLRHFKSRFVAETDEGIWLEAVGPAIELLNSMVEQRQALAISFKTTDLRMSFSSRALRLDQNYALNATTTIKAVLIDKPVEVRGIQRRNAYRVRAMEDLGLSVRIWIISEQAHLSDRPSATQEIQAALRDISIGGLGILIENNTRKLAGSQRLRVELKFESNDMLLEGRLRVGGPLGTTNTLSCGVIFEKLENDLDGRRKLTALANIIGHLQRQEVRRARYSKAS